MAITAVPNLTVYKYTPIAERENDNPTTFDLKPLNGVEYMEVCAELIPDGVGGADLPHAGGVICLKHGLVGWSNLLDENGQEIVFNKLNFGRVPSAILSELATEIFVRAEVGEPERKNS